MLDKYLWMRKIGEKHIGRQFWEVTPQSTNDSVLSQVVQICNLSTWEVKAVGVEGSRSSSATSESESA